MLALVSMMVEDTIKKLQKSDATLERIKQEEHNKLYLPKFRADQLKRKQDIELKKKRELEEKKLEAAKLEAKKIEDVKSLEDKKIEDARVLEAELEVKKIEDAKLVIDQANEYYQNRGEKEK